MIISMNSGEILRNWGAGITDEARQISLQWALVKYNIGIKNSLELHWKNQTLPVSSISKLKKVF